MVSRPPRGKVCLYLFFVGPKGRRNRPNSVLLTTVSDDKFKKFPWVKPGNNWFGATSADLNVRPDDPDVHERTESFIRHAFPAVAIDLYSKETVDAEEVIEFRKEVSQITTANPDAPKAAGRIMKILHRMGHTTAGIIRDVLVNVASEAAKQILLRRLMGTASGRGNGTGSDSGPASDVRSFPPRCDPRPKATSRTPLERLPTQFRSP